MAVRDQNESDTNLTSSISLGGRASPPMEEQVTLADEYAPKIRKPYTITKQREKWSEEEHRKFLEALKLHGRAWRRIEEHVGTKTAVQIRSHAQKFFTKVVRDSNNGDASAVKSVEIPPPRPKRKPIHPYPRKLVIPVETVTLAPEELKRSASPENQSPTSVLSSPGSDAFDMVDSSKPSEGSSAVAENSGDLVPSELDERRGSVEASSTQCLKLFGKTLILAESAETSLTDVKDEPLSSTLTIGPPWGLPHVSAAFPCTRVHNPIPIKGRPIFHENDFDDNDTQKEGSSTGSNTECVSTESNGDKNSEIEAQSRSRASAPSSFLRRVSSTKRVRGFVPYKRCLVERDISSSALTGEEGEERRTWLCL